MTREQRKRLGEIHERLMNRIEARYRKPVFLALRSQVEKFTEVLLSKGEIAAKNAIERELINGELAKELTVLYREVGMFFAKRTFNEIERSAKEVKQFGRDEQFLALVQSYFRNDLLTKSVIPITQDLRNEILRALHQGLDEGLGYEQIARQLVSNDFLLWRALRIVRTETLFAMQYGQETGQRVSNYETNETWIATKDLRTRHSHREVDGQQIRTGERFRVPVYRKVGRVDIQVGIDLMKGPGDRNAHAANVINCRCTKVTRAARDANGNLIRKQNNVAI